MKRKTSLIVICAAITLVILFSSGPRISIDTTLMTTALPEDLDLYLSQKETRFADITPGTEAKIIWADTMRIRSEFSIVYLHGFSATRRETAPLCDSIAAALDANLYYPRLTGHGRTGEVLATATVNNWLNDANEAVEIGRRLGDKLILIGNSTGATLATWISTRPENGDIFAFILISPNFGLHDKRTRLLLMPWARYTIPVLVGKNSGFTPFNRDHEKYWTSRYPTAALLPMMGLVKLVGDCLPATTVSPVMVIYSPHDKVLDVRAIERFHAGLSSTKKRILPVLNPGNEECHVIAGEILSPETTHYVAGEIARFIQEIAIHENVEK